MKKNNEELNVKDLEDLNVEETGKERGDTKEDDNTIKHDLRVYPEDKQKLQELTEKYSKEGGQKYVARMLVKLYEFNEISQAVPGRADEMEDVRKALDFVRDTYANSIRLYNNLNSDVRRELNDYYASELQNRDRVITELREQVDQLKAEKATAEKGLHEASEDAKRLMKALEEATGEADERKRYASRLDKMLADATKKLEGYDVLRKSADELGAEVTVLKHKLDEGALVLRHTIEKYEMRLADAQAIAERCNELEASNRELGERIKDAERTLSDHKKEAELATERAVMAKERELRREFREREKELGDMLREAEKENARLAGQNEQFKADLSWLPPVAQTQ